LALAVRNWLAARHVITITHKESISLYTQVLSFCNTVLQNKILEVQHTF